MCSQVIAGCDRPAAAVSSTPAAAAAAPCRPLLLPPRTCTLPRLLQRDYRQATATMNKFLYFIYLGFFLSHIPITLFVDSQAGERL